MADQKNQENMLQVGTLLSNGKYRIDQYLASGGFGNTYVATDLAFNEKVAIKELFIDGLCGRSGDTSEISITLTENQRKFSSHQEKFRKEARRLRKLSNPHIVKVHDLFDENQTSYYVMDFVEGESLSVRLKRTQKPLTEAELMLILPQVLDALECVHKEGIWHLDLKPANIMIDAKGNVQLIDFGASKQMKNANGENVSTSSSLAYTEGFAPSEQMEQNMDKFGPWTDLYALGATMYNLLTRQKPPLPSDIEEDSHSALKLPANISKKTSNLIFWLMKPNRKMRPQSVSDVRQFLVEAAESPHTGSDQYDGNDFTIIKNEKSSKPSKPSQPSQPTKPDVSASAAKTSSSINLKPIIIGVVVLVGVLGGFLLIRNLQSDNAGELVSDTVPLVDKQLVSVSKGPDNMHRYFYSGEWDAVTNKPDGSGVAEFAKYGDIPAATYKGNFEQGLCTDSTGEAELVFVSGDKFIGTFEDGYYVEGKYILSDKSCFVGTFKNGTPYNGKWYSASGKVDGTVVNGKEQ